MIDMAITARAIPHTPWSGGVTRRLTLSGGVCQNRTPTCAGGIGHNAHVRTLVSVWQVDLESGRITVVRSSLIFSFL